MMLVPAATPKDVIARLNAAAVKVLGASHIRERYAGMGVEPAPSKPERAAAYRKSETDTEMAGARNCRSACRSRGRTRAAQRVILHATRRARSPARLRNHLGTRKMPDCRLDCF
jgi:hypothetical protein